MAVSDELLRVALSAAVPLRMAELRAAGSITDQDVERVRGYAQVMAEHGDDLLYRRKGETAARFNQLADALAVMAYLPGGVTFLGLHFESSARSG